MTGLPCLGDQRPSTKLSACPRPRPAPRREGLLSQVAQHRFAHRAGKCVEGPEWRGLSLSGHCPRMADGLGGRTFIPGLSLPRPLHVSSSCVNRGSGTHLTVLRTSVGWVGVVNMVSSSVFGVGGTRASSSCLVIIVITVITDLWKATESGSFHGRQRDDIARC